MELLKSGVSRKIRVNLYRRTPQVRGSYGPAPKPPEGVGHASLAHQARDVFGRLCYFSGRLDPRGIRAALLRTSTAVTRFRRHCLRSVFLFFSFFPRTS